MFPQLLQVKKAFLGGNRNISSNFAVLLDFSCQIFRSIPTTGT